MVNNTAYARIWNIVARIPRGRVATYGQISQLAGLGNRARLVGYALYRSPSERELAWHRVINAQGKIAFPAHSDMHARQKALLQSEGIKFDGDRVDLDVYRWRPFARDLPEEYYAAE